MASVETGIASRPARSSTNNLYRTKVQPWYRTQSIDYGQTVVYRPIPACTVKILVLNSTEFGLFAALQQRRKTSPLKFDSMKMDFGTSRAELVMFHGSSMCN